MESTLSSQLDLNDFLSCSVSFDSMSASINIDKLPQRPLNTTPDSLKLYLNSHDIKFGIDELILEQLCTILSNPQDPVSVSCSGKSFKIAAGESPSQPVKPRIQFLSPTRGPVCEKRKIVRKGEIFARYIPGQEGRPGISVSGESFPPAISQSLEIKFNPFINFSKTTSEISSAFPGIGYVKYANNELGISSPVKISQDEMSANINIFPPCADEKWIIFEEVQDLLASLGVKCGILEDEITEGLKYVAETKEPLLDLDIARGEKPKRGNDGKTEYYFDLSESAEDKDNIDFWHKPVLHSIKKGETILEIYPGEQGTPGVTITGKIIPAQIGNTPYVNAGNNVEIKDSDHQFFTSLVDGVVTLSKNTVSISEAFEIKGDVGISTGNINTAGSLIIWGNILASFSVKVGQSLEVRGNIEDAVVEAGGAIDVGRGIHQKTGGSVIANEDIKARFVENAHLEAGASIFIKRELLNSYVKCRDGLYLTDNDGRIIGGTILVGELITAGSIGSPFGTRTIVKAGMNMDLFDKKSALQKEYKENGIKLKKLELYAGAGTENTKIVDPAKRALYLKMCSLIRDIKFDLARINQELVKIEEDISNSYNSKIQVRNTLFPGVELWICGRCLLITEHFKHATFFYSPEEGQIKWSVNV